MSKERLIYLPLGGAGEIGMNAYVYGIGEPGKERLILVDLGVTFPDMDTTPGVDLIFPDISWLEERRDRLEAMFVTHAHEDHVGAVSHYYDRLGAPIYARAFTANIARKKMEERGQPEKAVITASPWPEVIEAGPFKVGFVPISHSIPESAGLVIDTKLGRLVHSGDFKMDTDPVVGEAFDEELWASLSEPGVLALMCDSTNVFSPHAGRSESSLGPEIESLIAVEPDNPYFQELYGQMLFESGFAAESIPYHARSVELMPTAPLLRINLAVSMIATEDESLLDEAETHLRVALDMEPNNPFAWYQLSILHERNGDTPLAQLAIAEQSFSIGNRSRAWQFAMRARDQLDQGTTAYFRAAEIVAVTMPTEDELRRARRQQRRQQQR